MPVVYSIINPVLILGPLNKSQNMEQTLNSQRTLHTYGMCVVRSIKNIHRVIMAPHSITDGNN